MPPGSAATALASLLDRPWACERGALEGMSATLRAYSTEATIQAAQRGGRQSGGIGGGVGVLMLSGPIEYRQSFLGWIFGGVAIVDARRQLADLLRDPEVRTILLLVDSPGGDVTGLIEFARELREARQVKPIVGLADMHAYSAAYWLISQATVVIATPSSGLGSVGVYYQHVDASRALDAEGLTVTLVHAGRYKVEGNRYEPLGDEAERRIQREVDEVHAAFVSDIVAGRGRGLTVDRVKRTFGEGRTLTAKAALGVGMVDRVFDTTGAAISFASGYADELRLRARHNTDWLLVEHGDRLEAAAALRRIKASDDAEEALPEEHFPDVEALRLELELLERL